MTQKSPTFKPMRRNVIEMYSGSPRAPPRCFPTNIPAEIPYTHRSAGPNGIRICKKQTPDFHRFRPESRHFQNAVSLRRAVALSIMRGMTPMTIRNANVPQDGKSAASPQSQKYNAQLTSMLCPFLSAFSMNVVSMSFSYLRISTCIGVGSGVIFLLPT